jgi:hypothetical protein
MLGFNKSSQKPKILFMDCHPRTWGIIKAGTAKQNNPLDALDDVEGGIFL